MARRLRSTVLVVLTSLVLVAGVGVSAAAAHPATGDWRGNNTLCKASWCVRNGNLVRMWQALVYADHPSLPPSFVDGSFGPNTHNYTVWWQQQFALHPDGEVGPNTWGWANTRKGPGFPLGDGTGTVWIYHYYGRYAQVVLRQNSATGVWQFKNPNTGVFTDTNH